MCFRSFAIYFKMLTHIEILSFMTNDIFFTLGRIFSTKYRLGNLEGALIPTSLLYFISKASAKLPKQFKEQIDLIWIEIFILPS